MGAGLAKQIRNAYPEVYREYKYKCSNGEAKLGDIQPVLTSDNRICVNLFAQYSYGTDRVYTNYEAFGECLKKLRDFVCLSAINIRMKLSKHNELAFPMYIGCGLAGGDWNVIYMMLEKFSNIKDVVIVKKG